MGSAPNLIQTYRNQYTQFLNSYWPASTTTAGVAAYRPIFTGGENGSRIHAVSVSNPGSATTFTLAAGNVLTTQSSSATGALTVQANLSSTDDSLTRATGNWITDGWKVGMKALLVGCTTEGNNVCAYVTSVSATVLTLQAHTFSTPDSTGSTTSGAKVVQFGILAVTNLAADAGQTNGTAALSMLTSRPYSRSPMLS